MTSTKRRNRKKERKELRQEAEAARTIKPVAEIQIFNSTFVAVEQNGSLGVKKSELTDAKADTEARDSRAEKEIKAIAAQELAGLEKQVGIALAEQGKLEGFPGLLKEVVISTAHLIPTPDLNKRIKEDPTITFSQLCSAIDEGWKIRTGARAGRKEIR